MLASLVEFQGTRELAIVGASSPEPGSAKTAVIALDHVNIVVTDLDEMLRFYTSILDLRVSKEATIEGAWVEAVTGLADVVADVRYLEAAEGGTRLELIRYRSPEGARPAGLGLGNTKGLRHLAFRVEEIDAVAARLIESGAHCLSSVQQVPDAQVTYRGGARKRLLYFHDPEGNLLELCCYE